LCSLPPFIAPLFFSIAPANKAAFTASEPYLPVHHCISWFNHGNHCRGQWPIFNGVGKNRMSSYLKFLLNRPTYTATERIEGIKKKAKEWWKVKETKEWKDKNRKMIRDKNIMR
jgi:hypothetical protein